MTAANGAHHAASAALVLPDRSAATISRPRRADRPSTPASTTAAGGADGTLDVGPVGMAPVTPLPEPQLRPISSTAASSRARMRSRDSATG